LQLEMHHKYILEECTRWQGAGLPPKNLACQEVHAVAELACTAGGGADVGKGSIGVPNVSFEDEEEQFSEASSKHSGLVAARGGASARLASIILKHVEKDDCRENRVYRLVSSQTFELVFAFLIVLSACLMALESQYDSCDLGYLLKYPSFDKTSEQTWPGARPVFVAFDILVGTLFTIEVLLKLGGYRARFFLEAWNLFDTLIVIAWLFDVLSSYLNVQFPFKPSLLRVARLGKLLRLLKLVRTLKNLDHLFLMTTTLKSSMNVLFWAFVLVFTLQTMCAFLTNQIVVAFYLEDDSNDFDARREVFEYYGTFTRSMFTMFEITLGNWGPVARILVRHVSPWFMLFTLIHKLIIGFAIIGVINGIFIQETFRTAACDDHLLVLRTERETKVHARKMNTFFNLADTSHDGFIDRQEFNMILSDARVRAWLAGQGLEARDADNLFTLLDPGQNKLSTHDVIDGVKKLKGAARSLDLEIVRRHMLARHEQLQEKMEQIHEAVCMRSEWFSNGLVEQKAVVTLDAMQDSSVRQEDAPKPLGQKVDLDVIKKEGDLINMDVDLDVTEVDLDLGSRAAVV